MRAVIDRGAAEIHPHIRRVERSERLLAVGLGVGQANVGHRGLIALCAARGSSRFRRFAKPRVAPGACPQPRRISAMKNCFDQISSGGELAEAKGADGPPARAPQASAKQHQRARRPRHARAAAVVEHRAAKDVAHRNSHHLVDAIQTHVVIGHVAVIDDLLDHAGGLAVLRLSGPRREWSASRAEIPR